MDFGLFVSFGRVTGVVETRNGMLDYWKCLQMSFPQVFMKILGTFCRNRRFRMDLLAQVSLWQSSDQDLCRISARLQREGSLRQHECPSTQR